MSLSPSSSAQAAREAVARKLRTLKGEARLKGSELAARCGWSESKVSRIAHAKTPPSDDDVLRWCMACGAEGQAADIIAANRQADEMYVEWRKVHRDGMKYAQDSEMEELERTRLTRVYCSNVVPGLAQRRGYATSLMAAITRFQGTPDDVGAAVESRVARSNLFRRANHQFAMVLEETVLRYPFGGAQAMREQLMFLLEIMRLPRVSLGIIPAGAPREMWPLEAFYMYDDRQVTAELLSALVNITTPGEVAIYEKAFKILAGMAVYGPQARDLIQQAIHSFE
ncbi:helix-turn-helix transcriptional regulator [Kitasatospora sp. NPDC088351]|uniref:helix-turn-helix domain-containing protein n=1 Tax=Kitasatospora sp. NPDC088351 TaxID=3155180 RepID=UPI00343C6000